jgi:hypothetical protein
MNVYILFLVSCILYVVSLLNFTFIVPFYRRKKLRRMSESTSEPQISNCAVAAADEEKLRSGECG